MDGENKRRGCFQFSLRSILLVMTLTALGCGIFFGAPTVLGFYLLLFLGTVMPLALTIAIVYGRGYLRTFAIGALFPGSLVLLYSYALLASGMDYLEDGDIQTRLILVAYLVGVCFVLALYGGCAMLVRWGIERWQTGRDDPEPVAPHPESPFEAETAKD